MIDFMNIEYVCGARKVFEACSTKDVTKNCPQKGCANTTVDFIVGNQRLLTCQHTSICINLPPSTGSDSHEFWGVIASSQVLIKWAV